MNLVRVDDSKTEKAFLHLPFHIYKDDPNWIAPLIKDIKAVFDPGKNPVFTNGEAVRWILKDDKGEVIGRVAAFINHEVLKNMEFPVGGMGFFECIDDEAAAFILFDACRKWLEEKGMKGMDGPINFGERDRFWGLLVEGFDAPSYMENYNPPYYRRFFEDYGFRLYFEQHTFEMNKYTFDTTRLKKVSEWVARKPEYKFKPLEKKKLENFADDFVYIYNQAWQKFENFKPVTKAEILKIFKEMSPIIEPEYIWFAYVNDEPAGFIVLLPDVNQIFKYFNGRFGLLGPLKFLWYKYTRRMIWLKALVFGILPKFQNLGLDAVLLYRFYGEVSKEWKYTHARISWIGGFNPKMQSVMDALNGKVAKVHYTYRKLFDDSIPFKKYELGEYGDKGKG